MEDQVLNQFCHCGIGLANAFIIVIFERIRLICMEVENSTQAEAYYKGAFGTLICGSELIFKGDTDFSFLVIFPHDTVPPYWRSIDPIKDKNVNISISAPGFLTPSTWYPH